MQLARVIGDVVSTHKNPGLTGVVLLLVQPITTAGEPVGRALVAVDTVGAGAGEVVFFVRGKEAAFPYYPIEVPTDAGIVGIVDHWTREGRAPAAAATSESASRGAVARGGGAPRAVKNS
jgi:microcompartment protein CcmK/EutM